jgi:hypothetical protein
MIQRVGVRPNQDLKYVFYSSHDIVSCILYLYIFCIALLYDICVLVQSRFCVGHFALVKLGISIWLTFIDIKRN